MPATENDVTQARISAHGSVAAWREDFVARLGKAVSAAIDTHKQKAPYYYEVDVDLDLREMDTEEAQKLAFGGVFDVTDKHYDYQEDYLYRQDCEAVQDEIKRQLGGDFHEEMELLAEALGIEDPDELQDELLEEDALSPNEIDARPHEVKFSFRRRVAASAHVADFNLDASVDLLKALQTLRIPLSSYLEAACRKLDEVAGEDGVLSDAQIREWGLQSVDLEDEDEAAKPWSLHYRENIEGWQANHSKQEVGCDLAWFTGPPAIDPADLIEMALDQGGSTSLYLHVTVGSNAIDGFSTQASRHEGGEMLHEDDPLQVVVGSGYFCMDRTPGSGKPYTTDLLAPLRLPAADFSVLSDTPERDDEDVLQHVPQLLPYMDLYEAVHIQRKSARHDEPIHADDKTCIDRCRAILAGSPRWAGLLALQHLSIADIPQIRSALPAAGAEQERAAASALREEVLSWQPHMLAQPPRHQALMRHLLEQTTPAAIRDIDALASVSLFDLGCARLLPLDILQSLMPPAPTASSNALSHAVLAVARANRKQHDPVVGAAAAELVELLDDRGWSFGSTGAYDCVKQALTFLQPCLLETLVDNEERQQGGAARADLVNRLAVLAVERHLPAQFAAILQLGADPDAPRLEQAMSRMRTQAEAASFGRESLEQKIGELDGILRAHRAREAATAVLKQVLAPH